MRKATIGILMVLVTSTMESARADPGYYVVTAYDYAGERSVDLRYWSVKARNSPAVEWPEIGFGYGISSRWFSQLLFSYIRSEHIPTALSTVSWQNDYLLTQGERPFDLAIHTMLSQQRGPGGGYLFEYGPVFQTDVGRTQLNANLFLEAQWGGDTSGPTQMKYQWQVRHRFVPLLHVGAQGFGELGRWNHWAPRSEQSHRAGPAVFGTWRFGNDRVGYQAAYLFGSTYGIHANMFTVRVQVSF